MKTLICLGCVVSVMIVFSNYNCYSQDRERYEMEISILEEELALNDGFTKYPDSINYDGIMVYYFTQDTDFIRLKLTVVSDSHSFFPYNKNSFIVSRLFSEEIDLQNVCKLNFDSLLITLFYSQVVIENQKGDYRFFYLGKRKKRTMYNSLIEHSFIIPDDRLEDNVEYYYFKEDNDTVDIITEPFLRENLKIKDDDDMIRIHYLFKSQDLTKFDSFHLVSNWININRQK